MHLRIKDHAVVTNIDGDIQHAHNFNLIIIVYTISGPVLCTDMQGEGGGGGGGVNRRGKEGGGDLEGGWGARGG